MENLEECFISVLNIDTHLLYNRAPWVCESQSQRSVNFWKLEKHLKLLRQGDFNRRMGAFLQGHQKAVLSPT